MPYSQRVPISFAVYNIASRHESRGLARIYSEDPLRQKQSKAVWNGWYDSFLFRADWECPGITYCVNLQISGIVSVQEYRCGGLLLT